MSRKLTYEFVKESFENEGYTLLSKEYSKGHEHSISWGNWKFNYRCPSCYGNTKLTLNNIREIFENEGYTLDTKEYVNSKTKLDCTCSKGHSHKIRWNDWQQGCRCPTCRDTNLSIKFSGPGGSNWKGGISYEPYCPIWKDKTYKKDIRERDGNKCLNPYCSKNNSRLTIHHIDYNKKNCSPSNLITVCSSCNSRANTDRDWHTTWYQALMYMRYNNI